jgi:transposase
MPCSPVYAGSLYPCDLTDAEWALLAPRLPAPARRGRPRLWALRLLVNALFYVLRPGCAWRYLPRAYPPWQTTYTTFRQWRLRGLCSGSTRRCAAPSAYGPDAMPTPRRQSWTARV